MLLVNMHEAKTNLSKLVKQVEKGEIVRIARNGKSVVELCAVKSHHDPLKLSPKLKGKILGDIVAPLWPDGWDTPFLPKSGK